MSRFRLFNLGNVTCVTVSHDSCEGSNEPTASVQRLTQPLAPLRGAPSCSKKKKAKGIPRFRLRPKNKWRAQRPPPGTEAGPAEDQRSSRARSSEEEAWHGMPSISWQAWPCSLDMSGWQMQAQDHKTLSSLSLPLPACKATRVCFRQYWEGLTSSNECRRVPHAGRVFSFKNRS